MGDISTFVFRVHDLDSEHDLVGRYHVWQKLDGGNYICLIAKFDKSFLSKLYDPHTLWL